MRFSVKGMLPLASAVFLLSACGGGGGGSGGSVGTGGTPSVGESSLSVSSSSVKPLVKTIAKEDFFPPTAFILACTSWSWVRLGVSTCILLMHVLS